MAVDVGASRLASSAVSGAPLASRGVVLTYLTARRRELLSGVLFRPALVAFAFAVLGIVLPWLEEVVGTPAFAIRGDPAAVRSLLSTIAASLITVAALSFSLMIVTLQLVSSQFTPRAVRELLADRTHQLTIGTFVGIFVYCLLLLRLIRADDATVPSLSVFMAIVFAVGGLLLLVVFIHNLSQSIKVSRIAAHLSRETLGAIDELYPDAYRGEPGAVRAPATDDGIRASEAGYVQSIRMDALIDAARAPLHVRARPGDFVTPSAVLVGLDPGAHAEAIERAVRQAVHIAEERDIEHDSAYGMRLLADVALRALSPGVNDPTTAVTCIHYLGTCLEELVTRDTSSPRRVSAKGVEILVERVTFDEHLQDAFDELVAAASGHPRVARELATVLERAARAAERIGADGRVRTLGSLAASARGLAADEARTRRDRDTAERDAPLPEYERVRR